VDAYGSQRVDGSSSRKLGVPHAYVTVTCDRSGWQAVCDQGAYVARASSPLGESDETWGRNHVTFSNEKLLSVSEESE
jgi:hypothetical protein